MATVTLKEQVLQNPSKCGKVKILPFDMQKYFKNAEMPFPKHLFTVEVKEFSSSSLHSNLRVIIKNGLLCATSDQNYLVKNLKKRCHVGRPYSGNKAMYKQEKYSAPRQYHPLESSVLHKPYFILLLHQLHVRASTSSSSSVLLVVMFLLKVYSGNNKGP